MKHTINHILVKKPLRIKLNKQAYLNLQDAFYDTLQHCAGQRHHNTNTMAVTVLAQMYRRLNKPLFPQQSYGITVKHEEACAMLHLHRMAGTEFHLTPEGAQAWQYVINQIHPQYC